VMALALSGTVLLRKSGIENGWDVPTLHVLSGEHVVEEGAAETQNLTKRENKRRGERTRTTLWA
jgi:hypothetical protein